ncbi:hypothetical protein GW796_10075 [archaeon]|nr:hypothetical protein [archaeon]
MEDIIQKINDDMSNITTEDWPLLKELEKTSFSLKNRNRNKQQKTLSDIKLTSDMEDRSIEEKNIEDEKIVNSFFDTKSSSQNRENLIATLNKNIGLEDKKQNKEPNSVIPVSKVSHVASPEVVSQQQFKEKPEMSKLVAIGMAKIYVDKTDTILNPLRFLLRNAMQIIIALFQFVIPAIITWYLTFHVESITTQLSKENNFVYFLYMAIFYFACMFLWISGQVLVGGIWNMIKYSIGNLAKAGKN